MILSGWQAFFFWFFGLAAIFAALLTVMARNAIHSALFLISSLVSVAALFILAQAEFIAGVQILVYVGGVMVLFLFVIMLVNVGAQEQGKEEIFNRPRQVGASLIFCFLLVAAVLFAVNTAYPKLQEKVTPQQASGDAVAAMANRRLPRAATLTSSLSTQSENFGAALYRYGSLPFEIASVLLLVAIIGSVMLARTLKQERSADDIGPEEFEEELIEHPEVGTVAVNAD
jgi:NADH-quinone oxidoreductase subunit J